MRLDVPFLVRKPGAAGPLYYWQPSPALRRAGHRGFRLCGPDGRPVADDAAAIAAARAHNATLPPPPTAAAAPAPPAPGAAACVAFYRARSRRWQALAPASRRSYRWAFADLVRRAGATPIAALTTAQCQTWYDEVAATRPSFAHDRPIAVADRADDDDPAGSDGGDHE